MTESKTRWLRTENGLEKVVTQDVIPREDSHVIDAAPLVYNEPVPPINVPEVPNQPVQSNDLSVIREEKELINTDVAKDGSANSVALPIPVTTPDLSSQTMPVSITEAGIDYPRAEENIIKDVTSQDKSNYIAQPTAVVSGAPPATSTMPVVASIRESIPTTSPVGEVMAEQKPVSIYFGFGSYQIQPEEFSQVVAALKLDPNKKITVTGYTDDIGPKSVNDALALRRAMSVMQMLIVLGVPDKQIEVDGCAMCGLSSLDEITAETRRMNRRVDIKHVG